MEIPLLNELQKHLGMYTITVPHLQISSYMMIIVIKEKMGLDDFETVQTGMYAVSLFIIVDVN